MMKMTVSFTICLCLFTQVLYAQDTVLLKLDTSFNFKRISLPFKKIIVADARFDRSKIGCVNKVTAIGLTYRKRPAVLPDSLHSYLPSLITSFADLDEKTEEELFVLIKKFRIAENIFTTVQQTLNNYFTFNLSASFFRATGGKLTKLFSVEDVFVDYVDMGADVKLSLDYQKNQRSVILTKMLYKMMAYRNWESVPQGPSFAVSEVDTAIARRFGLPVYQHQTITGLHKNFAEFKNATPSVRGIAVKYKNNKIAEVTDASGNKIQPSDYWGVSDNGKHYIVFRNEFAELLPCDRSFRFLSYRTVAELTGNAVIGDQRYSGFLGSLGGGKKIDEYFDLDMDSGEPFIEEVFGKSKMKNHVNPSK